MLVSSLYQHLPRVLVLPLLLLGLSACQPVAPKKASSHPGAITFNKQQPTQPGSTEPNFACSYYYFFIFTYFYKQINKCYQSSYCCTKNCYSNGIYNTYFKYPHA